MPFDREIDENYFTLGQIYNSLIRSDCTQIRVILKRGFDVNYGVPFDSPFGRQNPQYVGYTTLHFAVEFNDTICIDLLLKYNADVTCQNHNGFTPVRLAFNKEYTNIIDTMLLSQVNSGNLCNPSCKDGISHFHISCYTGNVKVAEFFLKNNIPINDQVNIDSSVYPGYTPLHFAIHTCKKEMMKLLLMHDANINCVDGNGMSPLRFLLKNVIKLKDDIQLGMVVKIDTSDEINDLRKNESIIDYILEKNYILNKNSLNPVDDVGLSYFHISCVKKTDIIAKQYMEQGTNVNAPLNVDSPIWPGYTPLHFAAHSSFRTVMLLFEKGGNILSKDAKGVTPLDICANRYQPCDISVLLNTNWNYINFENGTNLVDALRAMNSLDIFCRFLQNLGSDINTRIPFNSPIWPGYTILHLAVIFTRMWSVYVKVRGKSKFSFVKKRKRHYEDTRFCAKCLLFNSDLTKQDANGMTPLHLAFYLKKRETVSLFLGYHTKCLKMLNNPNDINDLSHFHIACAENQAEVVKTFLLRNVNPNVTIKTNLEWFRCGKSSKSVSLQSGSTPLHMAIDTGAERVAQVLLYNGIDINYPNSLGFSALHYLFAKKSDSLCQYDLQSGKYNIMAKAFRTVLLRSKLIDTDHITSSGLSYLHIACRYNDLEAVQALLPNIKRINEQITSEITDYYPNLSKYVGYTPLHFAVEYQSENSTGIVKLLLKYGADVRIKNAEGFDALLLALKCKADDSIRYIAMKIIKEGNWFYDNGLTRLHTACVLNVKWKIKDLLESGEKVNKQINLDSIIYPGDTPLHLFVKHNKREHCTIELFTTHEADLTLQNKDGSTPVHLMFDKINNYKYYQLPKYKMDIFYVFARIQENDFYKSIFFKENPSDKDGLSHFHLSCIAGRSDAVKQFLKNNVDINARIDPFAEKNSGCTPLHMAILYESYEVVRVLLNNGADPMIKDAYGGTPLFLLTYKLSVLRQMMKYLGTGQRVRRMLGITVIDMICKKRVETEKDFEVILKQRLVISFNDIIAKHGEHTPIITLAAWKLSNKTFHLLTKVIEDITAVDSNGRTILYYAVFHYTGIFKPLKCDNYKRNLEFLIDCGCELDHKDSEGKTALHYAMFLKNYSAVKALLEIGSDLNIEDDFGNVPIFYCLTNDLSKKSISTNIASKDKYSFKGFLSILSNNDLTDYLANIPKDPFIPSDEVSGHRFSTIYDLVDFNIAYLKCVDSFIHKQNKRFFRAHNMHQHNVSEIQNSIDELKQSNIFCSFTFADFFAKEAMHRCSLMTKLQRQTLRDACSKILKQLDCNEVIILVKRQYRKCLTRFKLIEPAILALQSLIGQRWSVSYNCCRDICSFLRNEDLMNLIRAERGKLEF